MEDSLKYFQPKISDIRVGYECEVKPINEKFDWKPAVLKYNPGYESPGSKSLYDLKPFWWTYREEENGWPLIIQIPNLSHIRVPYLTKEQIEAEGWEYKDIHPSYNMIWFRKTINERSWYELDYYTDSKTMIIEKWWTNGDDDQQLFNGECKCINDFRLIIKMLCIK